MQSYTFYMGQMDDIFFLFHTCSTDYFGVAFIEILNDDQGLLPETFNESSIKLIPKNDKKEKI